MAALQYHCGCKTEGVGAPQRETPEGNALKLANFCGTDGNQLPTEKDPVTGEMVRPFWTKEKGGKVAWKYCPVSLARQVLDWLEAHPEGLRESYPAYLAAINAGMKVTGQSVRGRATHALRFNFAQRRYPPMHCLRYGDEEAKRHVSRGNEPQQTGYH